MQANALLNVLMSMPGSTAAFVNGAPAASGNDLSALLLGLGGAPAQNTTALNSEFAGILNNKLADGTQTALLGTVNATTEVNPTGDTTPSPQDNSSIAIPPLGMFIDQPAKPQVIASDTANADTLIADTNSSKSSQIALNQAAKDDSAENARTTNGILEKIQLANGSKGKLNLEGLETASNADVNQEAFLKAFAKIAQQGKANSAENLDKLNTQSGNIVDTQEVDISTRTNINEAFAKLGQNEHSISAKILSVKEYGLKSEALKLDVDNALVAGSMNQLHSKFGELDKHIKFDELVSLQNSEQTRVDQIHLKIKQGAEDGMNNIKIKLYPVELGQVEIDMDTDKDGNTSIRITAENQTAIDILRKDAHNLERSLRDAGLKTDGNTLEFSLRGDQQNQQQRQFSMFGENHQSKPNYAQVEGYSKSSSVTEREMILSMSTDRIDIMA